MFSFVCSLLISTAAADPALVAGAARPIGIATPADTIVVCPAPFEEALRPWLEYRRGQGHVVTVVSAAESKEKIKERLHAAFKLEPKLSIVLVGDVEDRSPLNPAARAYAVPTHYAAAKINVLFGSEPTIATDNWYADFDDDGVPEASIGRLPIDSAAELDRLTKRIIAYEQSTDFGTWRRKINFVAGMGGFGYLADAAIESAAKSLLMTYLPPEYESTMTYASWRSPYFPGAEQFHDTTVRRFNEGCLMWVYIGHGGVRELDRFQTPDEKIHRIFDANDVGKLTAAKQPPIALFLSCYSAAFDASVDCLGEEMLRAEGGPIAVLGGSRVTMPYAMSILGQELMSSYFVGRAPTIGRLMLDAKRGLALKPRTSDADKLFDAVAAAMMPMAADLKAQRLEHLQLFNLLGDPLLRLKHPERIVIETPAGDGRALVASDRGPAQPLVFDAAGQAEIVEQPAESSTPAPRRQIEVSVPFGPNYYFELAPRRDQPAQPIAPRTKYDPAYDYQADYETKATRSSIEGYHVMGPVARYAESFQTPPPGDYYIRVYVAGPETYALGAAKLRVVPAKPTVPPAKAAEKPKSP